MKKIVWITILLVALTSCIGKKGEVTVTRSAPPATSGPKATVSTVQINTPVNENQLKINGTNLDSVTSVRITGPSGFDETFEIDSKSSTELIISAMTAGLKVFGDAAYNLILNSAYGASTVPITFTHSQLGANAGDFLQWDGSAWVPANLSGTNFLGTWDATGTATSDAKNLADGGYAASPVPANGSYYVVSNAGTQSVDGVASWALGDWIIFNSGTGVWEKLVQAPSGVTTFNGRSGVVSASAGDYSFDMIGNSAGQYMDYRPNNVACSTGDVLKYNNTTNRWECGVDNGAGAVSETGNVSIQADSDSNASGDIQFRIGSQVMVTVQNDGDIAVNGDTATTFGNDRHSVADTAGTNFTLTAGGATTGATDKDGGDLVLSSGLSTGTGTSKIEFQTSDAGGAGTTDNTQSTKMVILGDGSVGIGTETPSTLLHVSGSVTANAFIGDGSGLTNLPAGADDLGDHTATQQLVIVSGSVSSPGLAFGGDTDTGIYVSGSDTLGLVTGGSEKLRIASDGKVGIGTSSPDQLLHVVNAGPTYVRAENTATTGYAGLDTKNDSGSRTEIGIAGSAQTDYRIIQANEGYILSSGDNLNILSDNATGSIRFGVGTSTDPSMTLNNVGNLTVSGSVTANAFIGDGSGLTGVSGDNLGDHTATTQLQLTSGSAATPALTFIGDTDSGLYTSSSAPNSIGLATGGTSRLFVNSSGNIGIGTESPSSKLDIVSSHSSTVPLFKVENTNATSSSYMGVNIGYTGYYDNHVMFSNSGVNSHLITPTGNVHFFESIAFRAANKTLYNTTSSNSFNVSNTTQDMRFYINGANDYLFESNGNNDRLIIKGDTGNVGIGTTAPSTALHVSGSVTANAFVGDGSGLTGIATDNTSVTDGYVPRSNGTSLVNSSLYVSGSNVGIRDVSPEAELHVQGDGGDVSTIEDIIIVDRASNQNNSGGFIAFKGYQGSPAYGRIGFTKEGGSLGTAVAGFSIYTGQSGASTEKVRVTNTGRMGIGLTSPSSALHVSGSVTANAFIGDGSGLTNLPSSADNLGDHTATTQVQLTSGSAAAPGLTFIGDTDTGLYTSGSDGLGLATGGSNRLFIDSAGRIGVGTTTPGALIDVRKSTTSTNGLVVSSRYYLNSTGTPAAGLGNMQQFYLENDNNEDLVAADFGAVWESAADGAEDAALVFRTAKNGTAFEHLRIDADGNVGIGTNNPSTKLEVNGTATADTFIGKLDVTHVSSSVGSYLSYKPNGSECNDGEVLKWTAATDRWECAADSGAGGADASALRGETIDTALAASTSTNGQILEWNQTLSKWQVGDKRSETDVEGFIANDVTQDRVPYDDGSKLTDSPIYVSGSNVGIGVAPQFNFDVGNGIMRARHLNIDSTAVTGYFQIGEDTTADGFFIWDDAGGYRFAIDKDTGNVGIGTYNASEKLVVAGNSLVTGNSVVSGSVTATAFIGDGSGLTNLPAGADDLGDHTATTNIQAVSGSLSSVGYAFNGDLDTGLYSSASDTIAFVTNGSPRFIIESTGNTIIPGFAGSGSRCLKVDNAGNLIQHTGDCSDGTGDFLADGSVSMTGTFKAVSGSVSAPSITFDGDTNTGIYSSSSDTLNLVTGGADRMHIASDGRIGIGKTSPQAQLDIEYSNSNSGIDGIQVKNTHADGRAMLLLLNDNNKGLGINILGSNHTEAAYRGDGIISATDSLILTTDGSVSSGGSEKMYFLTGGNDPSTQTRMLIDETGKVGIGTTAPSTALHVSGSVTATAFIGDGSGLTNLPAGADDLGDHTATQAIQILSGSASAPALTFVGDTDTGLYSSSSNTLNLATSGATRFSILPDGKIGIGTESPGSVLSVNGTTSFSGGDTVINGITISNASAYTTSNGNFSLYTENNANETISFGAFYETDVIISRDRLQIVGPTAASNAYVSAIKGGGSNYNGQNLVIEGGSSTGTGNGGFISFQTSTSGTAGTTENTPSERVRITNDGKVGIGTTAPSTALHVSGSVTATAFIGDGSGLTGLSSGGYQDGDVIRAASGSASAPGISFDQDPDTGIYQAAVGEMRFIINGVQEARLSSTTLNINDADIANSNGGAYYLEGSGPGSVTNPTYSFTGDTNTGAFSPAADTFAITTAGSERFRIAADGDVGIGTNLPLTNLDIVGNATGGTRIYLQNTDTGGDRWQFISTGSGSTGGAGNFILFNSNIDEAIFVSGANGNVGIGMTTPDTALHVSGSVTANAFIGDGSGLTGVSVSDTSKLPLTGGTMAGNISLNGNWLSGDGANEGIAVDSNGYVGIGTASPSSLLTVRNTGDAAYARIQGVNDGTNYSALELWNHAETEKWQFALKSAGGDEGDFVFHHYTSSGWTAPLAITKADKIGIGTIDPNARVEIDNTTANDSFVVNQGNASGLIASFSRGWTEKVVIDNQGYMGIGTNNPSTALHVSGSVTANTYYGDGSNLTGISGSDNLGDHTATTQFLAVSGSVGTPGISFVGDTDTGITQAATGRMDFVVNGGYEFNLRDDEFRSSNVFGAMVYGGNGSAATPNFTTPSDNNTGMYRASEDELGFSTGGVEALRIDNARNVGIGTSDPKEMLHVSGAINSYIFLEDRSGGVDEKIRSFNNNDGDLFIGMREDDGTYKETHLTILKDGKVGIGTDNPSYDLHVGTEDLDSRAILRLAGAATGTNQGAAISLATSADHDTNVNSWILEVQNDDFRIYNSYGSGIPFFISDSGYIGVSNSTPSVALDINGDIEYTGTLTDVSDRRLKTNIEGLSNGLGVLRKIDVYSFNMKDNLDRVEFGVIAQEMKEVLPDLVTVIDKETGYFGVNYMGLIPWTILGIKELDKQYEQNLEMLTVMDGRLKLIEERVSENERKIASLEEENEELKARVEKLEAMMLKILEEKK